MTLTPIREGTWQLPCLNCGRLLDYETLDDKVRCSCGISYSQENLSYFRQPGQWRHWIANFSCTCLSVDKQGRLVPKVRAKGDTVEIETHRCRQGQVTPGSGN